MQLLHTTFTPAPKRSRTIQSDITSQARKRDGFCLYGLLHKDGCSSGLDGHHIVAKGAGGDDILTNIISLCRYHHGEAEAYRIEPEELLAILSLYHGYKYEGVAPWTEGFLEA